MKIAFFGTSDRSTPILDTLYKNFDLALCVTKANTRVGRHQELRETGVKKWAKKKRVNCLTISDIKAERKEKIVNRLKTENVELGIVADFSFIIPQEIINTPKFKIINIHFSLLPKYRGASPVQFAILNGEKETGITYHLMDKGMDTGPILAQIKHKLSGNETSGDLYNQLFQVAADNLTKVITNYTEGKIAPEMQNNDAATFTYSKTRLKTTFIFKEDAKIDWNSHSNVIERQIRAYNPWPTAWTTLGEIPGINLKNNKNPNLKVKIYSAEIVRKELRIRELQVEGSKKITWEDFLNGYTN